MPTSVFGNFFPVSNSSLNSISFRLDLDPTKKEAIQKAIYPLPRALYGYQVQSDSAHYHALIEAVDFFSLRKLLRQYSLSVIL